MGRINSRLFIFTNKFYDYFNDATGPTKVHELERRRLRLMQAYYEQKYNRTKRLLELRHEQLLAEATLEEEKYKIK